MVSVEGMATGEEAAGYPRRFVGSPFRWMVLLYSCGCGWKNFGGESEACEEL